MQAKLNECKSKPILHFFENDVDSIISVDSYIDVNGYITHIKSGRKKIIVAGCQYFFSHDGSILFEIKDREINVHSGFGCFAFEKNKGNVSIVDNACYYINLFGHLIELTITKNGNTSRAITKCAPNNIFCFHDASHFFICDLYDGMRIINSNGYKHTTVNSTIKNYGLHYDKIKNFWLFVTEDNHGKFETYIYGQNKTIFYNDTLKYKTKLPNICIQDGMIFTPDDELIRIFSFEKNIWETVECNVINEDSKLIKDGTKIFIVNKNEIYTSNIDMALIR